MSSSTDNVEKSLVAHGVSWESFGLDPRISRAVAKLGWSHPTLVQSASIPRVLQGKDVLAKARTGSGKTAAYAVPIIQKILADKEGMSVSAGVRAVILVPTRELCEQVSEVITKLAAYCHHLVRHVFLSTDVPMDTQKHRLAELPDIVVATPGRLVQHLEKGHLKLVNSLKMIVIDEADLIFSFGYEKDVEKIVKYLPKISQGFLASATLGASVESLKKLILHTPVVLKLEEEKDKRLLLQQFLVKNSQWNEKYLQLYVLLKLKVISGKTIVFVNSIEGCYRLKLFLERLSVKSAVLNSELPQNSRYHIVQEFNRGLFNVLIATDEANKGEADDSDSESDSASDAGSDSENEEQEQEASSAPSEESSSDSEEEEKPSKSKKGAKAAPKKAEEKASSKSKKDASNGKSKKEELETATKKKKKSKKQESSDEDDSASFSGESFEGMDVDDDDDLEDVDDLEMGSDDASGDEEELEGSDEDSEDQTFESAKKEAEEAIEEIDTYRSVSKNALKVMQERLAAMTKAQEREEAESAAAKSGGAAGGSSSVGGRGRKNGVGSRADEEYGVSRGVDFRGIQTVVNFDFPRSSRAYTHRVGRTARAGQAGTALSFTLNRDEETLAKVTADQKAEGLEIKPYVFNQAAVDSFRYRIEGVLRTVTDLSIREARYEEIRREILGSQKLQTFFEENPREMELLKHDKSLLEKKINPQLKVVPDYIMAQQTPKDMQPLQDKDLDEEFLEHFGARRKGFGKRRLTSDPLKTFSPSTKKHKGPDGKETKRRGGPKGGRGRAPKNVSGRGNGRNGRYSAHVSGGPGT